MQRKPVVAGQFYPDSEELLRNELSRLIPQSAFKRVVKGIISPHAGYFYSGSIAGHLYSSITIPETIIIIGPNHHGAGAGAALYPTGEWLTPLGSTPISSHLNELLLQHTPYIQLDAVAHQQEHSLEVQLPFIQYLRPEASIAALCISYSEYPILREIASGVAAAIREYGKDVLIIASSDMTHYESADSASKKDQLALERALLLDGKGLLEVCHRHNITMCGVAPSTIMIEAVRQLGADKGELVGYGTSGDVTGDNRQVVGYAALITF